VRALQAFAQTPNQKVFIVPMELSSLAGTLGGISQIAAGAFGEGAGRAAGRAAGVVPDSPPPAPAGASPGQG
jgi:hypothetical protein